ncbi:MAG: tripartite tricarboxylate transporter substrate binding protein [Pseudomonadota bacterium]|nr:tripartite tricarboxylate transporter substrate binding protein [Pseudomonadota bacterium]
MKRRNVLIAATLGTTLALPAGAQGKGYPNRPIKVILPVPPGVSPDVVARIISDKLGPALGQPLVIDNRPGAGGIIAADAAVASPADGYTLFFATNSVMTIAPHIYSSVKYNPLRDFTAVTQVLIVPHIITATLNAPYDTLGEMVEYARRNPGKIDYASLGIGSLPHVAVEALAARLGIKLNHIPYKSNPVADVMSGVVSLYYEAATTAIPSIKGGKIKALAVMGSARLPALPDLPSLQELNPGLDPNGIIGNPWLGFFAPARTPEEIVTRLSAEIVKAVKLPEVQTQMRALGLTPTGTSAEVLAATVATEFAFWGKTIRELGIKAQ